MKNFCIRRSMDYQEIQVEHSKYNKFYLFNNPNHEPITVIPDGCMDIQFVWQEGKGQIHLCGSFLQGSVSSIGQYDRCFGIKFNLGIIPDIDHISIEELINNRYVLNQEGDLELPTSKMIEYLASHDRLEDLVRYFVEQFGDLVFYETNHIIQKAIEEIVKTSGLVSVRHLAEEMGYSQCYISRVFKRFMGITLKRYASIIRCQNAIRFIEDNEESIIYEQLGYYDQAHFINEFKRFTSYTPYNYKKHMDQLLIV